jgi:hypothetical protein
LQAIAVAGKAKLAPTISGIARQVEKLLNRSPLLLLAAARVTVSPLNDPQDFITHLREAYSIQKFTVTFRVPNPWDVDKDFHEPFERFLAEADGETGRAVVEGKHLKPEPLEQVTASAAALGDDAEAKLRTAPGRRAIKKRLRGNPVTFAAEDGEPKPQLLEKTQEAYARVRRQPPSDQ